jgi:hypothetical protein
MMNGVVRVGAQLTVTTGQIVLEPNQGVIFGKA